MAVMWREMISSDIVMWRWPVHHLIESSNGSRCCVWCNHLLTTTTTSIKCTIDPQGSLVNSVLCNSWPGCVHCLTSATETQLEFLSKMYWPALTTHIHASHKLELSAGGRAGQYIMLANSYYFETALHSNYLQIRKLKTADSKTSQLMIHTTHLCSNPQHSTQ